MKRETKWFIVWLVAMLLAVVTDNFFLDVILAAATATFVTILIFGDRKKTSTPSVEDVRMTVLYGTSENRYHYAASHNTSTDRVILAIEPWKLTGLSHCPRIASYADWIPTEREVDLVDQTEHHLDVLERKYGIPSYDD